MNIIFPLISPFMVIWYTYTERRKAYHIRFYYFISFAVKFVVLPSNFLTSSIDKRYEKRMWQCQWRHWKRLDWRRTLYFKDQVLPLKFSASEQLIRSSTPRAMPRLKGWRDNAQKAINSPKSSKPKLMITQISIIYKISHSHNVQLCSWIPVFAEISQ